MDKDKLIADAWEAGSNEYFPDDPRRDSFEDGFKQGAEWLMQQPLSDRLTDEEKQRIRIMLDSTRLESLSDVQTAFQKGIAECLNAIFGKELFNHPTEV
ncbi:MAG: hypothetical protein HDS62_08340 [Bacteroidales bacterium]|nr:hypothetical protein [Bacteroidales bacterium]